MWRHNVKQHIHQYTKFTTRLLYVVLCLPSFSWWKTQWTYGNIHLSSLMHAVFLWRMRLVLNCRFEDSWSVTAMTLSGTLISSLISDQHLANLIKSLLDLMGVTVCLQLQAQVSFGNKAEWFPSSWSDHRHTEWRRPWTRARDGSHTVCRKKKVF